MIRSVEVSMDKYLIASLLVMAFACMCLHGAAAEYNVLNFGAKEGGKVNAAKAFLRAWASACRSAKAATVRAPKGTFLLSPVVFKGPCRNKAITFLIDGTLLAPTSGGSSDWIKFQRVEGVSIHGGTLDARGARLWACKTSGGSSCSRGDHSLTINRSKNVKINKLTSINSKLFHIWINGCDGVDVNAVKLIAPDDSPNTDGIHVQVSTAVTITSSTITTGDDCISVGPGTSGLRIEGVFCGPGHGISIGSLGNSVVEDGVQNVTVKAVVFNATDNGLRIKTWARKSTGFVKNVVFDNIIMKNVKNPILIDQNYCPSGRCPTGASGIKISDVDYMNVRGSSATLVAVKLDCSPAKPCTAMRLHNINLKYQNKPSQAYCKNAQGFSSGIAIPSGCFS